MNSFLTLISLYGITIGFTLNRSGVYEIVHNWAVHYSNPSNYFIYFVKIAPNGTITIINSAPFVDHDS